MPRIELLTSMFAGACGGLVGVLWSGIVSGALLRRVAVPPPYRADPDSMRALLAGAAAHATAGAMLGLLFWAGWSLIALVHVPWFFVGAAFGLACWVGVALPVLLTLGLRLRLPPRFATAHALEWLVSCVAIGLFCAWSWRNVA
jgi:hypothetical protein